MSNEYIDDPWDDLPVLSARQAELTPIRSKERKGLLRRHPIMALTSVALTATVGIYGFSLLGDQEHHSPKVRATAERNSPTTSPNFLVDGTIDLSHIEQQIGALPTAVAQQESGVMAVATYEGTDESVDANGIISYKASRQQSVGTAYKVGPDAVQTAAHVTEGDGEHLNCDFTNLHAELGGQPAQPAAIGKRTLATYDKYGVTPDISQVRINPAEAPGFSALPTLQPASEVPTPGTVVYNISRQGDDRGKFNDPISLTDPHRSSEIAGLTYATKDGKSYVITGVGKPYRGPLSFNIPGSSGSPYLNKDGQVWGDFSAGRNMTPAMLQEETGGPKITGIPMDRFLAISMVQTATKPTINQLAQVSETPCQSLVSQ